MIDEAAVRAALSSVLADGEIAQIVVEDDWVCVALGTAEPTTSLLERVHGQLARALPSAEIEVRAGLLVYRGGFGWKAGGHMVAVLGGKGGVGKSTMAVNLALTLSAMGHAVGIVDADLNAPDLPHLLGIHPKRPAPRSMGWRLGTSNVLPRSQRPRPHERLGVEVMSAGFLVPEGYAPIVNTRMLVSSLLRYLIFDVVWNADVLIIDAPPGTGEELQVIARELPLSGALFVTTPQDLAQMDAERTLALLTEQHVPVVGFVQNMAELTCPHCGREIDMFAESGRLAEAGLPVIGRVPFDVELSRAADGGRPLVLGDPTGPVAYEFARIGAAVRRWLRDRDEGRTE
jgi:ATP-binding protein involved in chromosome partitioning